MKTYANYALDELDGCYPWERDVIVLLQINKLKEDAERERQAQAKRNIHS
jgi:hypothetical protein